MKKKPARDIPNFSHAPMVAKGAPVENPHGQHPARPTPPLVVKPKTTPSKSGRRGV